MTTKTPGTGWNFEVDLDPKVAAARRAGGVSAEAVKDFALRAAEFDIAAMDPRPLWDCRAQRFSDCQGNAQMAAAQAAFTLATGRTTEFSPWYSYITSQNRDGGSGRDNGSTIRGGLLAAQNDGLCPKEAYPYPNGYTTRITQEQRDAAAPYKIKSYANHDSYEDILAWMLSGQGGSFWGTRHGFQGPGGNVITSWRPGPAHATAFLAPSTRKDDQGRNFLWLYNSGYPTPGYYELSADAINQAFRDSFTVCVGITNLTTPVPRPISFTNPFGE